MISLSSHEVYAWTTWSTNNSGPSAGPRNVVSVAVASILALSVPPSSALSCVVSGVGVEVSDGNDADDIVLFCSCHR
jgi:hypothetical protein